MFGLTMFVIKKSAACKMQKKFKIIPKFQYLPVEYEILTVFAEIAKLDACSQNCVASNFSAQLCNC